MMVLKYKEGMSIANHVSQFQSVMNSFLGMGVKYDDEILGLWLLATLSDSWETFWVSLINSAPQGIITLDLAKSGVLTEEKGHIKKYCIKLKRENKGGGDKHGRNDDEKSERATITREDLLAICHENLVNLACEETSWVIETGALIHVTSMMDFFTSYTHGNFGVLKMGNDGLVSDTGMRDFSLVSNNGTSLTLKDIRHAPDIRLNLISVGKLDDEVAKNFFKLQRMKDPSWMPRLVNASLLVMVLMTIDDIDKTEKEDLPDSGDLTDVNPIPLDPSSNPIQDDVHGDANDDQREIGKFYAPIDDVVNDQQQAPIAPPTVPLQRSSRDRRSSILYSSNDYVLLTDEGEHECYKEAMETECKDLWAEVMKDELQSLHDNHTFELVKLPTSKRALKNQWVYRVKQEEKSSSPRYKARLK
ncbi:hypothetical protein V6N11_019066 [Hibiscus sabdariffa]|uniref:Retrovirus-related Pol polyprotein from transposon TNT 1-94-like beta-barrel domain-containing protein n=1 Tax=Hibiscus sabdariffa TaxID=183260 RepID=A0ABR2R1C8_9ROSI